MHELEPVNHQRHVQQRPCAITSAVRLVKPSEREREREGNHCFRDGAAGNIYLSGFQFILQVILANALIAESKPPRDPLFILCGKSTAGRLDSNSGAAAVILFPINQGRGPTFTS